MPHPVRRPVRLMIAVCATVVLTVTSAVRAQSLDSAPAVPPAPPPQDSPLVTFSTGIDLLDAYMFRGIRQDDRGMIVWPAAEVGAIVRRGGGPVETIRVNAGLWTSLHSGPTGLNGPSRKIWYEADFYSGVTAGLASGLSLGALYTAYVSPNDSFRSVRELAVTVALDDGGSLVPLAPYGLVAFELSGQADGGAREGTYLEMGIKPGTALLRDRVSLTFPVKIGLSLRDYYERGDESGTFGFVEAGATAAVPLAFVPRGYGAWAARGGLSVLGLGDGPRAFNAGGRWKLVPSIGIGFSY